MGNDKINEIKGKLIELNEIIASFCPEIRSAAFDILAPFYFDKLPESGKRKRKAEKEHEDEVQVDTKNMESFFNSFDHKQPVNGNTIMYQKWE